MLFFHHKDAGQVHITLENTDFHSLIRVRRKKIDDKIIFINITNKKNNNSNSNTDENSNKNLIKYYTYNILNISKRSAELELISQHTENAFTGKLHLFWGICEIKTITSTLPILNQMGVEKITFVECERSQGNIKLTEKIFEKFNTILRSSCEQCGRNTLMEIDSINFQTYLKNIKISPNVEKNYICDFQENIFSDNEIIKFKSNKNSTIDNYYLFFIGPEGGFSNNERLEFQKISEKNITIRKFNTPLVLKSESACITVASFFL